MKHTCIEHPASEPLIIARKWQVQFCMEIGMPKKLATTGALLLSFLEYWHNIKLESSSKNSKLNRVAINHGDEPCQDESLLQFHTMEDIEESLLGFATKNTIQKARAYLVDSEVVSLHSNPNPKYKFDSTTFYLFHPEKLNEFLRSVKFDQAVIKNDQRVIKNDQTSTEITSEITSEYNNPLTPLTGGTEKQQLNDLDSEDSIDAEFEEFWEAYHKWGKNKEGKINAQKSFKRLNKKDRRSAIDKIPQYDAYLKKEQWRKKMLASKWLNKREFESEWSPPVQNSFKEGGGGAAVLGYTEADKEKIRKLNERFKDNP